MGSYWDDVTDYPYDGDIGGTNPVVRHVMSLTCTLRRMHANQCAPKHAKETEASAPGQRLQSASSTLRRTMDKTALRTIRRVATMRAARSSITPVQGRKT